MTHVNNVQSFEKLLGICTGYGGSYNPGKQNLRVENLTSLLMQANEKLLQVSVAKTSYQNAQNDREEAFAEIRLLASRIMAELKSSGILPQTVADAAEMMRKIRGYPFTEKPVAADQVKDSETSNTGARPKRSNADFANTVFNFEKLIQTVGKEPQYEPINPELQLVTLQEKLANLRAMNAEVVTTATAWRVARSERNRFLYQGRNSLHSIAMAVKQQMRATFGYKSEQTQAVAKIRFTKLNKL